MMKEIYQQLKGKKILILGFGREGKAAYRFIRKELPQQVLTIADRREIDTRGVERAIVIMGQKYQEDLHKYDLILKSPGIVLEDQSPDVIKRVTSQTELFLCAFSNQVIGITGTKGKSTTATLTYHILKAAHPNCLLMGNIGIPAFDLCDQINEDTLIVYELSCHQLEYIHVSPHVAVLLNLFEEHLDHYGTYENYIYAKENICRYQKANDVFICDMLHADDVTPLAPKLITISSDNREAALFVKDGVIRYEGHELMVQPEDSKLVGKHNLYNIGVAYAICHLYGVSDEQFMGALKTYEPLPHRLQNVGTYDGITFYDDSISTIGETTIQGMKSLPNVGTILLGGMDRGVDYTELAQYLLISKVKNIILMPDTDKRIQQLLSVFSKGTFNEKNILLADTLKDAVTLAKKVTDKGEICLLSPAAASYGFFKNFEERGEYFQRYVKGEE
ncbi:UDP-N-acetylmuramoyl-L-alanine--D-glutamate ligase [Fumia xinanensis]|uniref:UDP-N-acetylmuramoylalanine--D-glutamate ligase n=1 Tax=Fumia xinanensis TaxID=2763659 RepID=A0A926I6X1_9FIRM|nr:UDP-N-acetylmuramoyl-L-alanine--D-glutamate ligase [Fumia xinanensis]MBC8560355.1 UDP-N-acetylmuramoyl-L-alanine--D-glutamate ligase [Fumia xinanensis]